MQQDAHQSGAGSAPATPYTVNKESGHGPAWANSLFEDNAEHGFGIYIGQKAIRDRLIGYVEQLKEEVSEDKKPVFEASSIQKTTARQIKRLRRTYRGS